MICSSFRIDNMEGIQKVSDVEQLSRSKQRTVPNGTEIGRTV